MPKAKLEALREGMIVASAIKNADDVLLVPAGSIITSKHLNLFGSWDIQVVDVEPCPEAPSPVDALLSLSEEARTALESELKSIFWDPIDKNAVQAAIFELALKRKATRLRHVSH